MQISINEIELYMNCPRAYKFWYCDVMEEKKKSLSVCKANAIRKAVQQIHGGILANVKAEDIEMFCEHIWQEEITNADQEELDTIVIQEKPATSKKEATPPVTKGQRALVNLKIWAVHYAEMEKEAQVIYSDVPFEDTIGDTTFTGTISQIRKSPQEGWQVIVFNTSSQIPGFAYLKRNFSISLYAHALWQGLLEVNEEKISIGEIPAVYLYYFPNLELYKRGNGKSQKGELKGDPWIPVHRSRAELLQFEYEILYVASGIQLGFYPMNVTRLGGCELCGFTHGCHAMTTDYIPKNDLELVESK
ncbi:MAG: PD-(D/E)XK nuclease family protein [Candidatus Brocadiae bacterium]|nr:PD-(D/E)XK nuclease family protein [Candidatus Brocadiia bacterium]